MGLLLLIFIISGLCILDYSLKYILTNSHLWNLIELLILQKKIFNKSKHFHLHYVILFHQIFVNVFNIINISSIIINTKIIDISIKPFFFSYYLLTNLLKDFLGIIDLLQFQNLLLWICKFLCYSQTNNYLLHCSVNLNRISFLSK